MNLGGKRHYSVIRLVSIKHNAIIQEDKSARIINQSLNRERLRLSHQQYSLYLKLYYKDCIKL